MSKVPISVCIIAKDEERYIEECLKRLIPYGFEIIVTDTGSSDRTKEIAEKYADKVLDFKWINDFSAARNFCADHASNNWVLALDCDEYVDKVPIPQIRISMQKFPRMTGIVTLKNVLYDTFGNKLYSVDEVVRFYNRKLFHFENAVHEQLMAISDRAEPTFFNMHLEAIHMGYAITPEEMRVKQLRNLEILHTELEKKPGDPYTQFQIGQSLYILKNYEEAVDYFEKALDNDLDYKLTYVVLLICDLAAGYGRLGRQADALALMNKYADKCNTAKFVFTHGTVYYENEEYLKALLLFLKVIAMPEAQDKGEMLLDCYESVIAIYNRMGQPDMAKMFIEKRDALKAEKEKVLSA
jgi:glycosyltransferase involved in cell wall biosynthesis